MFNAWLNRSFCSKRLLLTGITLRSEIINAAVVEKDLLTRLSLFYTQINPKESHDPTFGIEFVSEKDIKDTLINDLDHVLSRLQ
jgi:hypothetical protein